MDWSREFPGLEASTYLNSCAHGLLPARTRKAIERHLDAWEAAPDWTDWMREVDEARRAFARLVHAREDEIAVHAHASSAVSSVLSALRPRAARRQVLTADVDFPVTPMLARLQAELGLTHAHVPLDAWKPTHETLLASTPAVVSFTGQKIDIRQRAEEAHAAGAMLLVDAFQAAGTYDIDVREADVDFLVTGVYKWLMAPPGLSFLYVRRDHFDLVPTTSSWQALDVPYSFDPHGPLAPDARRYQQGGPSIVGCVGATASLGLVEEVGIRSIEARNRALTQRVVDGARERGWEVLTPDERGSIVTFRPTDTEKALAACKAAGIVVNPRLGGIRVSPHFYNRDRDVERLFEALDGAVGPA